MKIFKLNDGTSIIEISIPGEKLVKAYEKAYRSEWQSFVDQYAGREIKESQWLKQEAAFRQNQAPIIWNKAIGPVVHEETLKNLKEQGYVVTYGPWEAYPMGDFGYYKGCPEIVPFVRIAVIEKMDRVLEAIRWPEEEVEQLELEVDDKYYEKVLLAQANKMSDYKPRHLAIEDNHVGRVHVQAVKRRDDHPDPNATTNICPLTFDYAVIKERMLLNKAFSGKTNGDKTKFNAALLLKGIKSGDTIQKKCEKLAPLLGVSAQHIYKGYIDNGESFNFDLTITHVEDYFTPAPMSSHVIGSLIPQGKRDEVKEEIDSSGSDLFEEHIVKILYKHFTEYQYERALVAIDQKNFDKIVDAIKEASPDLSQFRRTHIDYAVAKSHGQRQGQGQGALTKAEIEEIQEIQGNQQVSSALILSIYYGLMDREISVGGDPEEMFRDIKEFLLGKINIKTTKGNASSYIE